jgi:hypothetical protein
LLDKVLNEYVRHMKNTAVPTPAGTASCALASVAPAELANNHGVVQANARLS